MNKWLCCDLQIHSLESYVFVSETSFNFTPRIWENWPRKLAWRKFYRFEYWYTWILIQEDKGWLTSLYIYRVLLKFYQEVVHIYRGILNSAVVRSWSTVCNNKLFCLLYVPAIYRTIHSLSNKKTEFYFIQRLSCQLILQSANNKVPGSNSNICRLHGGQLRLVWPL